MNIFTKTNKLPIEKTSTSIEKNIDFSFFQKIYAGFSGGADSTALLIILKGLSVKHKFQLTAVHFEHGLRGIESINDAQWCKEFCKKHNVKYLEFELDVKGALLSGEGIESCARRLRLDKLASLITPNISQNSPNYNTHTVHRGSREAVALGHHQDDKVENLFLRLMRGSNSSGLTSLRHSTILSDLHIIRPLLGLSKIKIESFLTKRNITDWRVDKTNKENLHRRNIIRNKVLRNLYKLIPESRVGILRAEEVLKDDAEYLEQLSRVEYTTLCNSQEDVLKVIPIQILYKMHVAIRTRVLRYWLTDLLGFEFIPSRALLNRIDYELKRQSKNQLLIPLFSDIFLKLEKDNLFLFEPKNQVDLSHKTWNWEANPNIRIGQYSIEASVLDKTPNIMLNNEDYVYFDYSLLPTTLYIRPWNNGDRFTPFGLENTIKVKRIFKNKKVSTSSRKQIPLLCLPDDTIIWIAGFQRSNFGPISKPDTKIGFFMISKEKLI